MGWAAQWKEGRLFCYLSGFLFLLCVTVADISEKKAGTEKQCQCHLSLRLLPAAKPRPTAPSGVGQFSCRFVGHFSCRLTKIRHTRCLPCSTPNIGSRRRKSGSMTPSPILE